MTEDTPVKVVVDCSTGESTTVPFTEEEIVQLQADTLAMEARELAEATAKAEVDARKATLLATLASSTGLAEDDLKFLIEGITTPVIPEP
jgi:hypothetical protein